MSREEAAWAEIRRAYEAGDETVSSLAARLRVSEGAIYRRARRDGWARRSKKNKGAGETGCKSGSSRQSAGRIRKPGKGRGGSSPSASLIKRLYNAINAKLKRLEARMQTDHEITAAESERETRELGSMIRSFEKVTAFAESLEERDKSKNRKPQIAAGDAERMREEIAQRLERLCADRDTEEQSEHSER